MDIRPYTKADEKAVLDLILGIQQHEFNVPVSIADQPDLLDVKNVYQHGKGNFWVAMADGELVGTIALIDIGQRQSALRKMFVRKDYRGGIHRGGQRLLDHVINWCRRQDINEIFLGTHHKLEGAQQFYRKNGFSSIEKKSLPESFPVMPVDDRFFQLEMTSAQNGNTNA